MSPTASTASVAYAASFTRRRFFLWGRFTSMEERGASKEGRFTSAAGRVASVEGRFTSIASCFTSLIGGYFTSTETLALATPLNNPRTTAARRRARPLFGTFPREPTHAPPAGVRFRKPKSQNRKSMRRDGRTSKRSHAENFRQK